MEQIISYFPNLSDQQLQQLERLGPLYADWNSKINVISRKDIDNLYERHVLHSLSIAKFIRFRSGAEILDLGTGGGFPGIPLAIFFPNVQFTLIDGTLKKIKVVNEVKDALGLTNVNAQQIRAEELKAKYDFVVSRAVAGIDKLAYWSSRLLKNQDRHPIPNGVIALKGGNLRSEIKTLPKGSYSEINPLTDYFTAPFL